ncbi:MAG: hypothetical protein FWE35_20680, partial [Streptosporangiales bacterium]|nr:hypothetical protein [Streptosporangiales bacterium]
MQSVFSSSPSASPSASSSSSSSSPGQVKVSVASQKIASALGIHGVVFSVGNAAGTGRSRLSVKLDYSAFRDAYGGDYASRLHLVE